MKFNNTITYKKMETKQLIYILNNITSISKSDDKKYNVSDKELNKLKRVCKHFNLESVMDIITIYKISNGSVLTLYDLMQKVILLLFYCDKFDYYTYSKNINSLADAFNKNSKDDLFDGIGDCMHSILVEFEEF